MNSSLPKFRSDLAVRQQETEGGVIYIVKDPASGEFFRLREAEEFIARQLDGETSLDAVRERTAQKFGASLPAETLGDFVKTLKKSGLLDDGVKTSTKNRRKRKRFQGDLLSLRFRAFNPSMLLDRLVHRTTFLYTPGFVIVSASILLLAVWTAIESWNDYSNDLPRLYALNAIPLFLLINFLVVVGHEFAHGLTCRHFGGEVREMGFMIIYFQPALYCNVSDAWFFAERYKRMWVGFAGPYFELFLWALATLAWRITDGDTAINYIGLIVMTTSGIKTLVNFNPLIKFDGYYLLSDYLNIPNLRRKSFLYVGNIMKRLTGKMENGMLALSPRERRICLAYGVVATLFSFFLLGFATVTMGGILIDSHQPVPLAAFVGFAGLRFRDRLGKLFGRKRSTVEDEDDYVRTRMRAHGNPGRSNGNRRGSIAAFAGLKRIHLGKHVGTLLRMREPTVNDEDRAVRSQIRAYNADGLGSDNGKSTPKPSTDEVKVDDKNPVKPPNGNGKHKSSSKNNQKRRDRIRHIVIGYLAVFAGVILFFGYAELRVGGAFMILPVHNADVRSSIDGIVEQVYVTEGQQVNAGDLIALLSDRESRAELQKTQAQIQQLRARLAMLEHGPSVEEIDVAKAAVTKARDRVRYARTRSTRAKALFEKNIVAGAEFENSQEATVVAEGDLAEAQNKLKLLQRGARPEEIEGVEAEIASLEAQERRFKEVLQQVEVRSQVAGVVATPVRQLEALSHQAVVKGALIAKVFDFKQLMVEIAVSEKDIADVKVGQKVGFKARAYPDDTFYGTVTATASTALSGSTDAASSMSLSALSSSSSSGTTVLVRTVIDNSSLRLKPGMTGHAKIYCGERTYFGLLMRRLARVIKVEFWSWW